MQLTPFVNLSQIEHIDWCKRVVYFCFLTLLFVSCIARIYGQCCRSIRENQILSNVLQISPWPFEMIMDDFFIVRIIFPVFLPQSLLFPFRRLHFFSVIFRLGVVNKIPQYCTIFNLRRMGAALRLPSEIAQWKKFRDNPKFRIEIE